MNTLILSLALLGDVGGAQQFARSNPQASMSAPQAIRRQWVQARAIGRAQARRRYANQVYYDPYVSAGQIWAASHQNSWRW
jgi:hypothetical protein